MKKFLLALALSVFCTSAYAQSLDIGPVTPPSSSGPSWSIDLNSNQTGVASVTYTTVGYNHTVFDTDSVCDIVTNKGRCTPNKAGKYSIQTANTFSGTLTAGNSGNCNVALYKNGSIFREVPCSQSATSGGAGGAFLVDMNGTTDFIEIRVFTLVTGTATVSGTVSDTWYSGTWIRP